MDYPLTVLLVLTVAVREVSGAVLVSAIADGLDCSTA